MRYGALDISSKTGWAVWDGHTARPFLGRKTLVGWSYDSGSMLEFYRLWLGDFIRIHRPDIVAVEGWIIAAHLDATTIGKQIQLAGFTEWAMKKAGIRCIPVAAATWRKTFHGTGRASGDEFKTWAKKRCDILGWEYEDDNAAEAGGLLHHAITQIGRENPPWRDHPCFNLRGGAVL